MFKDGLSLPRSRRFTRSNPFLTIDCRMHLYTADNVAISESVVRHAGLLSKSHDQKKQDSGFQADVLVLEQFVVWDETTTSATYFMSNTAFSATSFAITEYLLITEGFMFNLAC